jgi:hypothetical protein
MIKGDRVRVLKSRDTPTAIGDKVVPVVKVDELSIWVEHKGETYVLDRSQVRKEKP